MTIAASVCLLSATAAARAAVVSGWVNNAAYDPTYGTASCMDFSTQYGLRLFGCNLPSYDAGYQKWEVGSLPSEVGEFTTSAIVNLNPSVNPQVCVDYSHQYGLRGFPCNSASYNSGYQAWQITLTRYGFAFNNVYDPTQCIDWSSRYGLRAYLCNSDSVVNGNQTWEPLTYS